MYQHLLDFAGITQGQAEWFIVVGVVGFFLLYMVGGMVVMFLPQLMVGACIVLVISVFMHSADTEPAKPPKVEQKEEIILDPSKNKSSFMEQCISLTNKPEMCEDLFSERDHDSIIIDASSVEPKTHAKKEVSVSEDQFRPVSAVKLLDVDNQEYKDKRAAAISKPNAVVLQTTMR